MTAKQKLLPKLIRVFFRQNWFEIFFLGGWATYFIYLWSNLFIYSETGDLIARHVNTWGDWVLHFMIGTSFVERGTGILSQNPLLITEPLQYPLVADVFSGLLMKFGVKLVPAFVIPSLIFSVLGIVALYWFYRTIFRSKKIAAAAASLFMLNGGLGFIYSIQSMIAAWESGNNLWLAATPATNNPEAGIKWISIIDSMLLPQRAFTLGLPIALILLTLMFRYLTSTEKKPPKNPLFLLTLMSIGFLPIIHTHTAIAVAVILTGWFLAAAITNRWKLPVLARWTAAGVLAASVGALITNIFIRGTLNKQFFVWEPGWLAPVYNLPWIKFWLLNWGVVPLLAFIGLVLLYQKKRGLAMIFLPFFLLFAAANLVKFQPWNWDNTKIIVWAALGFAGLAAYFLQRLWQGNTLKKFLAVLLFAMSILSGGFDAIRIIQFESFNFTMFQNRDLEAAEWVRKNTSPDSIWIAHDDHHGWLGSLAGRQTIMSYRGWLWSHGYDYLEVEADLSMMFAEPESSEHIFEKYNVDYVFIGHQEIEVWGADNTRYNKIFPVINEDYWYSIYRAK